MEPNNNYEQEIDLKDLMFAVLRKWRPIIVIAVVFAVLLGALKTVKGISITLRRGAWKKRLKTCSRILKASRNIKIIRFL